MSTTLARLLCQSAARRPDHTAVEDPDRQAAITYRDLDARSDELRDLLVREGVRPGDRVGICVPKSIASVTAVFGILKARAAYVPVDSGAPVARNAGIFEDCSIKMAFVEKSLLNALVDAWTGPPLIVVGEPVDDVVLIGLNRDAGEGQVPRAGDARPDDLSYILYTSGSTGRPKGVVHTNASALSFVDWCSEALGPNEDDRFSSHAPFHGAQIWSYQGRRRPLNRTLLTARKVLSWKQLRPKSRQKSRTTSCGSFSLVRAPMRWTTPPP